MRHYLTACRDWQLPVLLGSMRRHCGNFRLHVLAWDFDPHDAEWLGPDVEIVPGLAFLREHPEYEYLPGPPRLTINHIDTARWRMAADLIAAGFGPLTYIDGDQFFFSSPEPAFEEIGAARMAVSPHRIPPASAGLPGVTLETHRCYGLFNSGWVYLADVGIADRLARACFDWCYSEVVSLADGRFLFGDQGHLERIATAVGGHVIQHRGVNVAPWNVHGLDPRSYTPPGGPPLPKSYPVVGAPPVPIITYHYSTFSTDHAASAPYEITRWQDRLLYDPYRAAIEAAHPGRIR